MDDLPFGQEFINHKAAGEANNDTNQHHASGNPANPSEARQSANQSTEGPVAGPSLVVDNVLPGELRGAECRSVDIFPNLVARLDLVGWRVFPRVWLVDAMFCAVIEARGILFHPLLGLIFGQRRSHRPVVEEGDDPYDGYCKNAD